MVQPGGESPRRYPRGLCQLPDQHGVIGGIDKFDAGAFSIAPVQAKLMDPQVRVTLEVVTEALLDAGLTPADVKGSEAGVFVGCCGSDTHSMYVQRAEATEQYVNTGNSLSLLANRVSFVLDIHGPSEVIDTACSSSMFAFEHAYAAVASGRCPLAVVAGANLCLRPGITSSFNQLQMLSPSGRCAHMDAAADGYARSETIAAVVLTSDAYLRQPPYAHVVAAATNNDGWKPEGLTFPSDVHQASLINALYERQRVDRHQLAWIEMHGTGTQGGDKRESAALVRAIFEPAPDRAPLRVRSVKSNMGHSEGASGVASVIATAMALHRRRLPGNLHYARPNPDIPGLAAGQLVVVQTSVPLSDAELRAQPLVGINSFGFGGANAHVVLAAAGLDRSAADDAPRSPVTRFVMLAGRTAAHLAEVRAAVERRLAAAGSDSDNRDNNDNDSDSDDADDRRAAVAANINALMALLDAERWPHRQCVPVAGGVSARRAVCAQRTPQVFWCFTGMGSQWTGMLRELMHAQPAFARSFTKGSDWLSAHYPALIDGGSMAKLIEAGGAVDNAVAESSVGLVLSQLALVDCLRAWGVPCAGVLGHSVGEISAAYASGALAFEDALRVVAVRATALLAASVQPGQMLVTGLDRAAAQKLCDALGNNVWLACLNGPSNTTLAGHPDGIAAASAALEKQGVFARVVPSCGFAFHSPLVEPVAPLFLDGLRKYAHAWRAPDKPWYCTSAAGGPLVGAEQPLRCDYFINNLLSPVYFLPAVERLPDNAVVFEIGPSAILRTTVVDARADLVHIGALRKPMPDSEVLEVAVCTLFEQGASLRLAPHTPHAAHDVLPLIWDHSKTWLVPQDEAVAGSFSSSSSSSSSTTTPKAMLPISGKLDSVAALLEEIRRDVAAQSAGSQVATTTSATKSMVIGGGGEHDFLRGHTIQGTVLVPATGYLYFLRQFAEEQGWLRRDDCVQFQNVHFLSATPLTAERPSVTLEVHMAPSLGSFVLLDSDGKTPVVRGTMDIVESPDLRGAAAAAHDDNDSDKCALLSADYLYGKFQARGYEYHSSFRLLSSVRLSADSERVAGQLSYRPGAAAEAWVPLLDGMLQALLCRDLALSPACLPAGGGTLRLPTFLQKCVLGAPGQLQSSGGATAVVVDPVTRAVYTPVARMEGLQTRAADVSSTSAAATASIVHESEQWVPLHADVDVDDTTRQYSAAVTRAVTKRLARHTGALPDGMAALLAHWRSAAVGELDSEEEEAEEERLAGEPYAVLLRLVRHMYEEECLKGSNGAACSTTTPLSMGNARDRMFSFAEYDKVYTDDPLFASFYRSALQLVVDVLLQAFGDESASLLRVAEVGSGTGGTTVQLVPLLTGRSNQSRIEYHATDISASFFPALKEKARAFASTVELRTARWDLSEPAPAGVRDCHLLVADNVVHAVAPLHVALANLSAALTDGGFLLLREITYNHAGMMGVWGWLEETWPRDERTPRDYGCLMSRATWERALHAAGLSLLFSRTDGMFTSVLVAVKRPAAAVDVIDVRGQLAANDTDDSATHQQAFYERVVRPLAERAGSDRPVRIVADRDGAPGLAGFLRCVSKEDGWSGRIAGVVAPASLALNDSSVGSLPPAGLLLVELDERTGVWGTRAHAPFAARPALADTQRTRYHLRQAEIGDFNSFRWTPMIDADADAGAEAFAVAYCALNFKDAMLASGRLQADGAHLPLPGFEFAGVDEKNPQRRVMGISRYALSTRVYNDRRHDATLTFDVPDAWTLEDAATVPVVYLTAAYSLLVRAHLGSPGGPQSLLVHSGAGGVGIAALEIAFGLGLTDVYTTVSSAAKRDFLTARFPRLASAHIFNSRSASFRDDVLRATGGRGVDCVLNSLAGELLRATTEVVADGGCVVEIGRFDLQQNNSPFGMAFFEHNRCYHGVDLDQLFAAPPAEARRAGGLDAACAVFKDLLARGIVRPLPARVFPVASFATAMGTLAKGQHIGKLLVDMRGAQQAVVAAPPVQQAAFCPDAVYVVVGGLGGVGIALVDWLARCGARHFIVSARSAAAAARDADKAAALLRWRRLGLNVQLTSANAASYAGAVQTLQLAGQRRVDGVFLLSMVLRDALVVNTAPAQWLDVMAAKTAVAANMDRAVRQLLPAPPAHFVAFSSVAAGLGNAGQSAYAYANGCVEQVCRRRRADGMPALAVQWGAVGDVGFVARHGDKVQLPGAMAMQPIDSVFDSLTSFIFYNQHDAVVTSYARRPLPTIADVAAASGDAAAASPAAAAAGNGQALLEKVAQSLGHTDAAEAADHTRSFVDEGMDSLTNTRVRNILKDALPGLTSRELGAMTWQQLSDRLLGGASSSSNSTAAAVEDDNTTASAVVATTSSSSAPAPVWPPASPFRTMVEPTDSSGSVVQVWVMCGAFIDAQHEQLHEVVQRAAAQWAGVNRVVLFDWTAVGDTMEQIVAAWHNRPLLPGRTSDEVVFAHSAAAFIMARLPLAAATRCIMIGMPTVHSMRAALDSIAQRDSWSEEQKLAIYASAPFTAGSSVPLMTFANPYLTTQFKILEDLTASEAPFDLPANTTLLRAEVDQIADTNNHGLPFVVLEGTTHDLGSIIVNQRLAKLFAV